MEQTIVEMTSTATIAIAVFGIVFCLMQNEYSVVSRSFAVFLAAVTVNNIPATFLSVIEATQDVYVRLADLIVSLSSAMCLAPLFWIYVFTLTSTSQRRPRHFYRHFLLPALTVVVGLTILAAPQDVRAALFSTEPSNDSAWFLTLAIVLVFLQIAIFPQIAIYLFLIIRRLMRYRLMLRDFYASTEEHELRWIYVIGGLGALFWLVQVLILLIAFGPDSAEVPPLFLGLSSLPGLGIVATVTLWGLRQRPPLVQSIKDQKSDEITGDQSSERMGEKYEKSALSEEASLRLARKLRIAMETHHLHRDPNLSLWALARHIGASPNYISQTLNDVIGENFFDFVNGYRIAEAMNLLSTTDATVLTVTYDVGFNARSSFYNAFKRVTGQTPTSYRKMMSYRAGMDDIKK